MGRKINIRQPFKKPVPRNSRRMRLATVFFLGLFFAAICGTAETRIGVAPVANATQNEAYDSICRSMSDDIGLALRFIGPGTFLDARELPGFNDLISPPPEISEIDKFARINELDEIIFGNAVVDENDSLVLTLSLYNVPDAAIKTSEQAVASTVFDVYGAVDEVVAAFLAHFTDADIGFGGIDIQKEAGSGSYSVYLDSILIRNPRLMLEKVLIGEHLVTIRQKRMTEDIVVYEQLINVLENEVTDIRFSIPVATKEEFDYVESRSVRLEELSNQPELIDELLREIAALHNTVKAVDYDQRLVARSAELLDSAGKTAVSVLSENVDLVDELYYSDNPDFADAKLRYGELSSLINDIYEYHILEGEQSIASPHPSRCVIAPDGTLLALENADRTILQAFSNADEHIKTITLHYRSDENRQTVPGIAASPVSTFYFFDPADPHISMFTSSLEMVREITIPDVRTLNEGTGHVAISDANVLYLLANDQVIVFEPNGDRQTEMEDSIKNQLDLFADSAVRKIFFDPQDRLNIYYAERELLIRLDNQGQLHSKVTIPAADPNSSISVDHLGYIYITSPGTHSVSKFTDEGDLITSFGKYGVLPGEFSAPEDIAVRPDGNMYIADTFNNRIQLIRLTAPPVLLPEVAQYGVAFAAREAFAADAVDRLNAATGSIKPLRPVLGYLTSIAGYAGALTLAVISSRMEQSAQDIYEEYAAATDPDAVADLRKKINMVWMGSRLCLVGAVSSTVLAASMLANGIHTTFEYAGLEQKTIKQIQAFHIDSTYELDASQYRSLRRAQLIGILTGILPPILGTAAAVTLPVFIPDLPEIIPPILILGSVALPPIWSHVYSGTLHGGLVASSMAADALIAAALLTASVQVEGWVPSDLPFSLGNQNFQSILNSAWHIIQEAAPAVLAASALSVRIMAGIYDTANGWIAARDFNHYRAKKEIALPVELSASPIIGFDSVGINIRLAL